MDAALVDDAAKSSALAQFLGYGSVDGALAYVHSAKTAPTHKQLVVTNAQLSEDLALKSIELHSLQKRYDDLLETKRKADERYQKDIRKLDQLALFIKSDELKVMQEEYQYDRQNLRDDERKARRAAIDALKEKKMAELGIQISFFNPSSALDDKENHPLPISTPVTPSQSLTRSTPVLEKSQANNLPRASSRNEGVILIPNTSDTELSPERPSPWCPIPTQEPSSPVPALNLNVRSQSMDSDLSRTETDYSQDPFPSIQPVSNTNPRLEKDFLAESVLAPLSSHKQQGAKVEVPTTNGSGSKVENDTNSPHSKGTSRLREVVVASAENEERPRKQRRVSSPEPHDRVKAEPGSSAATPLYVGSGDTPRSKRIGVTTMKKKPASKNRTAAKPDETPSRTIQTPVNARASSSKMDYSAYKGRGRYARSGPDNTINSKFAIDSARNAGMDFEYDDVVRGREQRRQLHGGACDCCQGYYEEVGPMPNRLQAPLWRSPPKEASKPTREEQVAAHKQAVSRHRENWTRGATPPGYWNIGFPNTQEVQKINEKAREMHQEKERRVEEEAAKQGGRYYRKG